MAVLGRGPWVSTLPPPSVRLSEHRHLNFSPTVPLRARHLSGTTKLILKSSNSRIRGYDSVECSGDSNSEVSLDDQNDASDITIGSIENKPAGNGSTLLLKLGLLMAVAVVITLVSAGVKPSSPEKSMGNRFLLDGSSSSTFSAPTNSFRFRAFGYSIVLPDYAPGWIYFWLLMAAACGLFISEEALNIWVGWEGVCISDMIPFYIGKIFGQSGASDDICSKLGIGKEKTMELTRAVKRYGNLIGFVERFSLGVRNPTAFLAGAMGVSPECFFVGVCCGGLVTLPLQLAIGFLLRERPVFALATVATVVGIWTVFPYSIAVLTALFLYLRRCYST
ncbi:hypothetical protein OROGR_022247 [Orobanche gracilis]